MNGGDSSLLIQEVERILDQGKKEADAKSAQIQFHQGIAMICLVPILLIFWLHPPAAPRPFPAYFWMIAGAVLLVAGAKRVDRANRLVVDSQTDNVPPVLSAPQKSGKVLVPLIRVK